MEHLVLGISGGIGSMLIGAKQAGFRVIGNFEDRSYYHTGTFEHNFKKAFFKKKSDYRDYKFYRNIDLIMSHPACGLFSNLRNKKDPEHERLDIMLNTLLSIKRFNPKFFVIDNLPKLLTVFDAIWWARNFSNYDIYFEYVSNYNYGNVQKNRKRLFIIGAKKDQKFVFIPGEVRSDLVVRDVLFNLEGKGYGKIYNHYKHVTNENSSKAFNLYKYGEHCTWGELKKYLKDKKEGFVVKYHAKDGTIKNRRNFKKAHWEKPSGVLSGHNAFMHAKTCLPYSVRERARIQGCPDNFKFIGMKVDKKGKWNHDKNIKMIRQTGRFICVQFCRYISDQIIVHLSKNEKGFSFSGLRFASNPIIDREKLRYCKCTNYSNKKNACFACWLRDECDKVYRRK